MAGGERGGYGRRCDDALNARALNWGIANSGCAAAGLTGAGRLRGALNWCIANSTYAAAWFAGAGRLRGVELGHRQGRLCRGAGRGRGSAARGVGGWRAALPSCGDLEIKRLGRTPMLRRISTDAILV